MKNNRSKALIYVVIFLTILNLSTLATIGYHIYLSKKDAVNTNILSSDTNRKFNGRYFKDQIGLSYDQMDLFRKINMKFRSDARRINDELINQRREMLNEMKSNMADTLELNKYSETIGDLHAQLKRSTYKYYMGIKNICSDDQINKLDQIFEEFFIVDEHFGNRDGGGQNRYGKQNNKQF